MTHTTQVLSDEQMPSLPEPAAWRTPDEWPMCYSYTHEEPDAERISWAARYGRKHEQVYTEAQMREYARLAIESATLKAVSGQEPIGYFRSLPFGWEDCAEFDEGAMPLFALPPAQPAPVDDEVIAGVLFDFMGWLTSRKQRIVLSCSDNASPAVDAIEEFAKMRGIDISNAAVLDWQARAALQCAQAPQPTKGQP